MVLLGLFWFGLFPCLKKIAGKIQAVKKNSRGKDLAGKNRRGKDRRGKDGRGKDLALTFGGNSCAYSLGNMMHQQ